MLAGSGRCNYVTARPFQIARCTVLVACRIANDATDRGGSRGFRSMQGGWGLKGSTPPQEAVSGLVYVSIINLAMYVYGIIKNPVRISALSMQPRSKIVKRVACITRHAHSFRVKTKHQSFVEASSLCSIIQPRHPTGRHSW